MENETDYTKLDESEMVETFSRMDPRRVPVDYLRLKELLTQRGFLIRDGRIGPGSAIPSPAKLEALIGSPHSIKTAALFSQSSGLLAWLEPAHNDFHLVGTGTLEADGIHLLLTGRRAGPFGSLFRVREQLKWSGIVDFESAASLVHFQYSVSNLPGRSITIGISDQSVVERLAAILPRERTPEFSPRLKSHIEFERNLISRSPRTPVTVALIGINLLMFLASLVGGAEFLTPTGSVQIAWGSNFGPYTTEGEWWRLFTALFIHFGAIHLMFNMWALAIFGPLVERLYGSMTYLMMYLCAGMVGSLSSILWRPEVNSAGASAAILGTIGALLAAQLRVGESLPSDIVRPVRNTALTFAAWTIFSGLTYNGVDNAGHLGGLVSGFLLGLVTVRPITGRTSYRSRDFLNLLKMICLASGFFASGVWYLHHSPGSRTGEVLYWQTVRWLEVGEQLVNRKYIAALASAKSEMKPLEFSKSLENEILPFWKEASVRLLAIKLEPGSQHLATLHLLQKLANGRLHGYAHLAEGLRKNDSLEIAAAEEELKDVDQLTRQ